MLYYLSPTRNRPRAKAKAGKDRKMNTKETLKSKAERAAYEDARDCLYFGSGKCFWRDCGLSPERREAVWRKAVEDMKASSSIGDRCADYLRARHDYLIVGRSVKMAKTTLDIVAYDRVKDCIVFAVIVPHGKRMGDIDLRHAAGRRYKSVMRAATNWRRFNRWTGGYRIDALHVSDDGITHVLNIHD